MTRKIALGVLLVLGGVCVGVAGGLTLSERMSPLNIRILSTDPNAGSLTTLFASDWSDSTGTSSYALLDSGGTYQWDSRKDNGLGGSAISDTVDWDGALPAGTNAMTIRYQGENSTEGVRLDAGHLPAFNAGETRGFRVYFKMLDMDTVFSGCCHPWQDGAGGSNTNWQFQNNFEITGTWKPQFFIENGDSASDCSGGQCATFNLDGGGAVDIANGRIPKDSVYRLEFTAEKHASGDSIRYRFYIYNSSGTLLYGPDDFLRVKDDVAMSNTGWYALEPLNDGSFTELQIGTNGWSGETKPGVDQVMWHWGAVCVADGELPGPYGSCDGEGG